MRDRVSRISGIRSLARRVEPARERRLNVEREIVDRRFVTVMPRTQPLLVERRHAEIVAVAAERMDVALPDPEPVDELDAELERGLSPPHEIEFVDSEDLVEVHDDGDRRLAHTDRADLLGFDELNTHQ